MLRTAPSGQEIEDVEHRVSVIFPALVLELRPKRLQTILDDFTSNSGLDQTLNDIAETCGGAWRANSLVECRKPTLILAAPGHVPLIILIDMLTP